MDLHDYKVGAKLNLDIYDDNGELIDQEFASQFEEALGPDEARLLVPIVEGTVYPVRAAWKVNVYMRDGNSCYRFQATIVDRTADGPRRLMRIKRTSEIVMAPRRQCYRLELEVPLRYRVVEWTHAVDDTQFVETMTSDISGGGLRFRSRDLHLPGELVECELTIGDKQMYLAGKVVRCQRLQQLSECKPAYFYDVGVLYSEIEPWQREAIFKFIFEKERQKARVRKQ